MTKRQNSETLGDISYINQKIKHFEEDILLKQKELLELKLQKEEIIDNGNHFSTHGQFFVTNVRTPTTIDQIQVKFNNYTDYNNVDLKNIENVTFLSFDDLFRSIFEYCDEDGLIKVEKIEGFDEYFLDLIMEGLRYDKDYCKDTVNLYYNISFVDCSINSNSGFGENCYSKYYYLINTSIHYDEKLYSKTYKFRKTTQFKISSKLELHDFLLKAWECNSYKEIFFPLIKFLSQKIHKKFKPIEFFIHYFIKQN